MTDSNSNSTAIAAALAAQARYEDRRQSIMGQGAERLTRPVGEMVARVVPPELVRQGLAAADRAAGVTLPKAATGHDLEDVAACEAAALAVQKWAMGSNAASGGVAGLFGAAGLTADVPATLFLAARNVRATAVSYGVIEDTPDERAFRLMVLELATAQGDAARRETLGALRQMAGALNTPVGHMVLDKGGEWVAEKVVERLLRQIGVSLGSRKAAQVVPVVGGAVAAMVNASFQSDVSRAARYAYRQRWLMRRRLLPAAPVASQEATS